MQQAIPPGRIEIPQRRKLRSTDLGDRLAMYQPRRCSHLVPCGALGMNGLVTVAPIPPTAGERGRWGVLNGRVSRNQQVQVRSRMIDVKQTGSNKNAGMVCI